MQDATDRAAGPPAHAANAADPHPDPSGLRSPRADEVMYQLAASAHACWCRSMEELGWKYGPTFNAQRGEHDALVPFDRLGRDDQWTLIETLEAEDIPSYLAELVDLDREAPAPLKAAELIVGLRVQSVPPPSSSSGFDPASTSTDGGRAGPERAWPPEPAALGSVVSWTVSPRSGRPLMITVQWDDGDVTHHAALEGSIRKADHRAE